MSTVITSSEIPSYLIWQLAKEEIRAGEKKRHMHLFKIYFLFLTLKPTLDVQII